MQDLLQKGLETLCKTDNTIKLLLENRIEDVTSLLNKYIKEIELFNTAYGLVGTNNTEELIIKHILDSITPAGIIAKLTNSQLSGDNKIFKIADAGSGAGLPGIPLAIVLPQYEFTLIERMGRRAGFLCNTKAVLSLSNITVEEKDIDKAPKNYFDLVTFRAFLPLDVKLLKTLFSLCAPGGIIAAYKGRLEKIEAEMAPLQYKWEAIPCPVPFLDEQRFLLVIKR